MMAVLPRLLLLCLLVIVFTAATTKAGLQLGVQGHCDGTSGQTPYRPGDLGPGVATQLADVRSLGAGPVWYRNGIGCDVANGTVDKPCIANFVQFALEAAQQNITLLPILFPPLATVPEPYPSTATELYEVAATAELWAFQVTSVLVKDAGLTTFELNNELDNQCIQLISPGNAPDGDLPSQFNETKNNYYRAMLRGLIAGVKRASSEATTIINTGGWLHYGWYTRLVADQLDFDIIGYHWYSSMGDFNDTGTNGGHTDVLQKLGKYGKRIWITEMNREGGSSAGSPARPDPSGETAEAIFLQHELHLLSDLAITQP